MDDARFEFHSEAELIAGKVDAATWCVGATGNIHELELKVIREKPSLLVAVVYGVHSANVSDPMTRTYLHATVSDARVQYTSLRERSPVPSTGK